MASDSANNNYIEGQMFVHTLPEEVGNDIHLQGVLVLIIFVFTLRDSHRHNDNSKNYHGKLSNFGFESLLGINRYPPYSRPRLYSNTYSQYYSDRSKYLFIIFL